MDQPLLTTSSEKCAVSFNRISALFAVFLCAILFAVHTSRNISEAAVSEPPRIEQFWQTCQRQLAADVSLPIFTPIFQSEVSDKMVIEGLSTIQNLRWGALKSKFKNPTPGQEDKAILDMQKAFRVRNFAVNCFLGMLKHDPLLREHLSLPVVPGVLDTDISAPGTQDPTSDYDVSILGEHALILILGYYRIFDYYIGNQDVPVASGEVFDTNIYIGSFLLSLQEGVSLETDAFSKYGDVVDEGGNPATQYILRDIPRRVMLNSGPESGSILSFYRVEYATALVKLEYYYSLLPKGRNKDGVKFGKPGSGLVFEEVVDHFCRTFLADSAPGHRNPVDAGLPSKFEFMKKQNLKYKEGSLVDQDKEYQVVMLEYIKTVGFSSYPPTELRNYLSIRSWHLMTTLMHMAAQESYFTKGPFMTVVIADQIRRVCHNCDDNVLSQNVPKEDLITSTIENYADMLKEYGHLGATKKYVLESSKYAYRFLEAALALNTFENVIKQRNHKGNAQNLNLLRARLLVFYGIRYLCRTYPDMCAQCYPSDDDPRQWEQLAVNINNIISDTFRTLILGSNPPDYTRQMFDLGLFLDPVCMGLQQKSRFLGVIIDIVHTLSERHCTGTKKRRDGFLCSYIERQTMSKTMERVLFVSIQTEPCDDSVRNVISEQECNRLRCDKATSCTPDIPRQNLQYEHHDGQCVFRKNFYICQELR